jgi:hypothetical protein
MFVRQLLDSVVRLPGEFAAVALHDPLSAVLLAFGALFVLVSAGYFGLLVLGAVAELFTPSPGGPPGQQGR